MADDVSIKVIADTSEVKTQLTEVRTEFVSMGTAFESVRTVMVSSTTDIKTSFSELSVAAQAAGEKAKESADKHEGLFSKLKSGVEHVADFAKEAMKSGGEVIELGKKVYEFAEKMGDAAEHTRNLSMALGLTVEQTQTLEAYGKATGTSLEGVTAAVSKMDRALVEARGGSDKQVAAFQRLNIDIDKSHTQFELFKESIQGFANITDPFTKISVAQTVFGKGFLNVAGLIGITKEELSSFDGAIDQFGAKSAEANEKGLKLAEAFDINKIAMQGVGNILMQSLAPAFTRIVTDINKMILGFVQSYKEGGEAKGFVDQLAFALDVARIAFSALGENAGEVLRAIAGDAEKAGNKFDGLATAMHILGKAVVSISGLINLAIITLDQYAYGVEFRLRSFASVIADIVSGHPEKAMGDYSYFDGRVKAASELWEKRWTDSIINTRVKLNELDNDFARWQHRNDKRPEAAGGDADGGATAGLGESDKKGKTPDTHMADLQERLANLIAAKSEMGKIAVDELAITTKFWAEQLAHEAAGSAHIKDIRAKLRDATIAMNKDAAAQTVAGAKSTADDEIAEINRQTDARKAATTESIKLIEQQIKDHQVSETDGYAKIKALIDAEKKAEIDAAAATLAARLRNDAIDIAATAEGTKDRKAALAQQARDAQAFMDSTNAADIAAAKTWTTVQIQAYQKAYTEAEKFYRAVGDFSRTNLEGLIKGTESWRQLFLNVLDAMLDGFLKFVEDQAVAHYAGEAGKTAASATGAAARTGIAAGETSAKAGFSLVDVARHLAAEVAKTAATIGGVAMRLGAEAIGFVTTAAMSFANALVQIGNYAAVAAAGAYAAIASIPFVGPVLAPIAAGVALAGVLALGKSLFSAEGGWGQVPYDGALTQLHKNEMVLPASIASPLRSSLAAGGFTPVANQNAANDGGGDQYHVTIQALDGASVHRLLTSDQGVRALKAGFAAGRASGVLTRESF